MRSPYRPENWVKLGLTFKARLNSVALNVKVRVI